jgi:hypothetical protein
VLQEDVRDTPLTSLELPLMFVRGTNDPFSTQEPWDQLCPRLTSKHLLVGGVPNPAVHVRWLMCAIDHHPDGNVVVWSNCVLAGEGGAWR